MLQGQFTPLRQTPKKSAAECFFLAKYSEKGLRQDQTLLPTLNVGCNTAKCTVVCAGGPWVGSGEQVSRQCLMVGQRGWTQVSISHVSSWLSNNSHTKARSKTGTKMAALPRKTHFNHTRMWVKWTLRYIHEAKPAKWTVPGNSPIQINFPRAGRAGEPATATRFSWSKIVMLLYAALKKPHWSQNSKY